MRSLIAALTAPAERARHDLPGGGLQDLQEVTVGRVDAAQGLTGRRRRRDRGWAAGAHSGSWRRFLRACVRAASDTLLRCRASCGKTPSTWRRQYPGGRLSHQRVARILAFWRRCRLSSERRHGLGVKRAHLDPAWLELLEHRGPPRRGESRRAGQVMPRGAVKAPSSSRTTRVRPPRALDVATPSATRWRPHRATICCTASGNRWEWWRRGSGRAMGLTPPSLRDRPESAVRMGSATWATPDPDVLARIYATRSAIDAVRLSSDAAGTSHLPDVR